VQSVQGQQLSEVPDCLALLLADLMLDNAHSFPNSIVGLIRVAICVDYSAVHPPLALPAFSSYRFRRCIGASVLQHDWGLTFHILADPEQGALKGFCGRFLVITAAFSAVEAVSRWIGENADIRPVSPELGNLFERNQWIFLTEMEQGWDFPLLLERIGDPPAIIADGASKPLTLLPER